MKPKDYDCLECTCTRTRFGGMAVKLKDDLMKIFKIGVISTRLNVILRNTS